MNLEEPVPSALSRLEMISYIDGAIKRRAQTGRDALGLQRNGSELRFWTIAGLPADMTVCSNDFLYYNRSRIVLLQSLDDEEVILLYQAFRASGI